MTASRAIDRHAALIASIRCAHCGEDHILAPAVKIAASRSMPVLNRLHRNRVLARALIRIRLPSTWPVHLCNDVPKRLTATNAYDPNERQRE